MNPEAIKNSIQAVIEGLTPLAEQMQVPINKLFGWAIRENYVTAAIDILWMISSTIFFIALYMVCKWGFKKEDNSEYANNNFYRNEGVAIVTSFAGVIGGLTFLVMFFISFQDAIGRLVNPEYHALQDIVSQIKDKD